jgi:uncharacterized protein (TIGR00162 family)
MVSTIEFLGKPKIDKAILIVGLPGIGLVGKIAVDYMLKQFKAKKIANIYSDAFPPSVTSFDGIAELIKDEIYLFEFKGKKFLFLAGPVQPALDLHSGIGKEHYEFAEAIINAAKHLKVKEIYTLAGINIGDKRLKQEPNIVVCATDTKTLKEFQKLGCTPTKGEGLISGAAGLLIGLAKKNAIKGACLMGETNAKLIYGDHGAAKKLIELLSKKYGFKLNMKGIETESKNIQKAFTHLLNQ